MIEIIATIILIGSVLGMVIILARKMPALANLPAENVGGPRAGIFSRLKAKLKNNGTVKKFSVELLQQKILSKIRTLSLRMENKTGAWLKSLRQKNLNKKQNSSDKYWDDLKPKDGPE